jgi:hypothetical protein
MTDPFEVPELTRGLRAFASPASLGGAHDRFFQPLLDARRAAKHGSRWSDRLRALDAERLDATIRATLGTFAAERYPKSAPDRRALAAELDEACGDLFDQLAVLRAAQASVTAAADDDARATAWGTWIAALRNVFAAADRGWEHIRVVLGVAAIPAAAGGRVKSRRAKR